uniref:Uncharacterized protein n=1 Tax=Arundo donax TaxID=35708 RepID=A0A0A9BMH2_ARUDO
MIPKLKRYKPNNSRLNLMRPTPAHHPLSQF